MENELENYPLVILAGGKSERMGAPKGLLDFNGTPWLLEQLKRLVLTGCGRVVIVLGYHLERYFNEIPILKEAAFRWVKYRNLKIRVCINNEPELGQFSSLQVGLGCVCENIKAYAVFVLPVDVPAAGRAAFGELKNALNPEIKVCVPEFQAKGGHPILFLRDFADLLLNLNPENTDSRLDKQIANLKKNEVLRIPVNDANVTFGFNTKDEWAEFLNKVLNKTN